MTMDMVYWKIMISTIICTLESRSGKDEVIEFWLLQEVSGTNRISRVLVVKKKKRKSTEFLYCIPFGRKRLMFLFFLFFFFLNRTGSNPKIRRNKIWGGQNGGILVYNSGKFFVYFLSVCSICLFNYYEACL